MAFTRLPQWQGLSLRGLRGLGDPCTPTLGVDPTNGQPMLIVPDTCPQTLTISSSGASVYTNPATGQTIFGGGSSSLASMLGTPTGMLLAGAGVLVLFALIGGRR